MLSERALQARRENWKRWRGVSEAGRERQRQAALCDRPWRHSTGPRTAAGKAHSRGNAIFSGLNAVECEPGRTVAALLRAIGEHARVTEEFCRKPTEASLLRLRDAHERADALMRRTVELGDWDAADSNDARIGGRAEVGRLLRTAHIGMAMNWANWRIERALIGRLSPGMGGGGGCDISDEDRSRSRAKTFTSFDPCVQLAASAASTGVGGAAPRCGPLRANRFIDCRALRGRSRIIPAFN